MPDLKSPASEFASFGTNGSRSANGHKPAAPVVEIELADADDNLEPTFLTRLDQAPPSRNGATAPIHRPRHEVHDKDMDETEAAAPGLDVVHRGRSLRMQIRFARTLWWAGLLFVKVLFWHYLMPRVIGQERVDRGSTGRFVVYAREFRAFAILMGGVMIKLGQFISTREDVLPEEITRELAGLQDEVPSVPNDQIRKVIEAELGPIGLRYKYLAPDPIAAASLGQVYRAQLLDGEKVVVKVQRPGIREIVYTDLAALRIVAWVANQFNFIRRRADMGALTEEFGRVLLEEISYRHEARNAIRFAQMFADDLGVYIPRIYTEHSTDSVLTIEDVTTIKINDYAALEQAGVSRKAVAKRLMDTYLRQVFEERFFHADPHPGNLFVYPLPHENGTRMYGKDGRPFYLIFVDFGMTGTLTPKLASGLINTLISIVKRDPDGLVKSYEELGFLMPGADTERIVEATKATFDQVWGLSMTEIKSFSYSDARELGKEFNDLLYAMPFQVPQDFIYLGRAMGILSGMATSLDPNFNPWQELGPYAQKMIARTLREGSAGGAFTDPLGLPIIQSLFNGNALQTLAEIGRVFINRTVTVPQQVDAVLGQLERGDLTVRVTPTPTYRKQLQRIETQGRRGTRATVFAALLISATLLYTNGDMTMAVIGYVVSGGLLLTLLFGGD
ncbi:MAG: AarF/ABC1/UbiB kinase family protein [Anaerolineae bacterium]|nr:AarF/ABC1/UbiB kinase family protein [Anaerolineae bacterium]